MVGALFICSLFIHLFARPLIQQAFREPPALCSALTRVCPSCPSSPNGGADRLLSHGIHGPWWISGGKHRDASLAPSAVEEIWKVLLSDGALIPRLPPANHPEGTQAAQEDRVFLLPGRGPCPSACLPRGALLVGTECGAR